MPVTMEPHTLLCVSTVFRCVQVIMALLLLRAGFHVLKASRSGKGKVSLLDISNVASLWLTFPRMSKRA